MLLGTGTLKAVPLTNVTTGANVGSLTQHQHICPSLRAVTLILYLLPEHHNVYTVHYIPCRLGLRLDIRLFVNAVALMTDWLNWCRLLVPPQHHAFTVPQLLCKNACFRRHTRVVTRMHIFKGVPIWKSCNWCRPQALPLRLRKSSQRNLRDFSTTHTADWRRAILILFHKEVAFDYFQTIYNTIIPHLKVKFNEIRCKLFKAFFVFVDYRPVAVVHYFRYPVNFGVIQMSMYKYRFQLGIV